MNASPLTDSPRDAFVTALEQEFGWAEVTTRWTNHTTAEARAEDREQWLIDVAMRLMPRPVDRDAPHRWVQGTPYEACAVCGTDPRNVIHREVKPPNIHIQNHYDRSIDEADLDKLSDAFARIGGDLRNVMASRPRVTRPEFDPASVVRAEDGSLVVPMPPRVDAEDRKQPPLRPVADPFGEY